MWLIGQLNVSGRCSSAAKIRSDRTFFSRSKSVHVRVCVCGVSVGGSLFFSKVVFVFS